MGHSVYVNTEQVVLATSQDPGVHKSNETARKFNFRISGKKTKVNELERKTEDCIRHQNK